MCLATSSNLLLVLQDAPKRIFPHELAIFWSAKKRRKDTFFPHPPSPSPAIFASATVVAFVLLRNSRFNFHCYTQREATPSPLNSWSNAYSTELVKQRLLHWTREATPTPLSYSSVAYSESARKWGCDRSRHLARKITKGIHSCKPASPNRPIAGRRLTGTHVTEFRLDHVFPVQVEHGFSRAGTAI